MEEAVSGELDENDLTPTSLEGLLPLLREINLDAMTYQVQLCFWRCLFSSVMLTEGVSPSFQALVQSQRLGKVDGDDQDDIPGGTRHCQ